ncbi:ATP-dependent transcriptional regulator, MalT-like, LuxR family [Modestobacter italicus]|uniref:ATP-dependent transcriptional regulator, MalT-like, LuxR family n=1 Tax=Modestobacter italicus (strain DSM 44449 / CECT 9708 / BC 501) TaxID=2732864 RepID=I4EXX0_MODI5|nr:ATP-dependent transcriptional regulator, MalT-like, LuxR family [Modestobacter marinus]
MPHPRAGTEDPAAGAVPPGLLRVHASKTTVPELPAEFTARPALRLRLDSAGPGQIVVVSAPAGSGKTLLLADWVRDPAGPETAWVTVDADDNDPRRLWSAVLTALHALPCLSRDGRPGGARDVVPPTDGDLVDAVVAVLETCDPPVRLVLDDVQELTGQDVLRDLNRLVRRFPAGQRLVLASRSDPPTSIPRLRLEGRVHEVRADALAFTVADTGRLLSTAGLDLLPDQVAALHARTEGWVAGLRLAALALRRTDDVAAFLASFSGDERSIAEYLTGEVLGGLGAEKRDLLRLVSVCSNLAAELAAVLTGHADADRVLDQLHHETALVERTSPGHYRIHPLLRSYLVADLVRHRPEGYRNAEATAAGWWSAQVEPVHALRHAGRAGDPGLLTALLHRWGVTLLVRGELGPLQRALAAAGPGPRSTDPRLALLAAVAHLDGGDLPAALAELTNARRSWPPSPEADLSALRAGAELLATSRGLPGWDHDAPVDHDRLPAELVALLHLSRGVALLCDPGGVDVEPARDELARAVRLAHEGHLGYLEVQGLWALSSLATASGDQGGAIATAEQAVAAATRHGRHPSAWTAGPTAFLAQADLLRGEPAVAAARAAEVLVLGEGVPPEAAWTLHSVHGAARADQGDQAGGLAELRAARVEFADHPATPGMVASLALLEHQVALENGNLAAASEVARWLEARVGTTGELLLLKARTEAARGRHDAVRVTLAPLGSPRPPVLLPSTRVEAHLLEAEAALHAGERAAARAALGTALGEAEAIGGVRPLALAGPLTQELLDAWLSHDRGRFAAAVAAARAVVVQQPTVLLSERELEVLALLPSLLSAREIADEFTVSVNTVKSHIRSIYAKLGVSSRRDAVAAARDRGVLR